MKTIKILWVLSKSILFALCVILVSLFLAFLSMLPGAPKFAIIDFVLQMRDAMIRTVDELFEVGAITKEERDECYRDLEL